MYFHTYLPCCLTECLKMLRENYFRRYEQWQAILLFITVEIPLKPNFYCQTYFSRENEKRTFHNILDYTWVVWFSSAKTWIGYLKCAHFMYVLFIRQTTLIENIFVKLNWIKCDQISISHQCKLLRKFKNEIAIKRI